MRRPKKICPHCLGTLWPGADAHERCAGRYPERDPHLLSTTPPPGSLSQ